MNRENDMIARTDLAERFFSRNGATYDQIASLSTLRIDGWWKKIILKTIPKGSGNILDQACGTGILTLKIARQNPQCRVIGVDLQDEYIRIARQKAKDLQLSNVEFIQGRAEDVVLEEKLDCITSSYLAKYADLDRLVAHSNKMLRKGGVLIMHELTYPASPLLKNLWKLNFRFLQSYGAWKYPEWETAFRELPVFLKETKWINRLTEILKENNFANIIARPLSFDASAIVSAQKG